MLVGVYYTNDDERVDAGWLEGIYLNVPCIRVRVQQPLRLSISLYGMHVGLTGGGGGEAGV